jgi:mannose-6-phosphate isomerase
VPGDTFLTPAGALHALGPGLLVYEIQQNSDVTYRAFDWNRPAVEGRDLHVDQVIEVTDVAARPRVVPRQWLDDAAQRLVSCEYFTLDLISHGARLGDDESFQVVTALSGECDLVGAGWSLYLSRFDTVLVPAAVRGRYTVWGTGDFRALVGAPGCMAARSTALVSA